MMQEQCHNSEPKILSCGQSLTHTLRANRSLACVVFVICSSLGLSISAEELDDLNARFAEARDPYEAYAAFEMLAQHLEAANELDSLLVHSDLSLSLLAGWRRLRGQGQGHGVHRVTVDDQLAQRFVGFIEGRVRVNVPDWWSKAVVDGGWVKLIFLPGIPETEYHENDLGLHTLPGLSIRLRDETAVLTKGTRSFSVAKSLIEAAARNGGQYLDAVFDEEHCSLAFHGDSGFPFLLVGLTRGERREVWRSEVWATGRSVLDGDGFHRVELLMQGDRIIVFGCESHGLYLEGFDKHTGKNIFRFCTVAVISD